MRIEPNVKPMCQIKQEKDDQMILSICENASAASTGADNMAISLPHTATVTIGQHGEYSARGHQYIQLWAPCCSARALTVEISNFVKETTSTNDCDPILPLYNRRRRAPPNPRYAHVETHRTFLVPELLWLSIHTHKNKWIYVPEKQLPMRFNAHSARAHQCIKLWKTENMDSRNNKHPKCTGCRTHNW